MTKFLILFFIILLTFASNAMQITEPICYLVLLPIEIQNHIAQYLEFNSETDDEFITRSKDCTKILPIHENRHNKQLIEKSSSTASSDDTLNTFKSVKTYSIDHSKIINLEIFTDIAHDVPQVTIFDIDNNTLYISKQLKKLSQKNTCNISHIALSRTGSHYAQLQIIDGAPEEIIKWQHWLIVQNIFSNKIQKFLIPSYYDNFTAIGFNKQGTKIVVHAKTNGIVQSAIPKKDDPETWHHIIPLTSEEEHLAKSAKTFEAFLLLFGCCKNLQNNLTH